MFLAYQIVLPVEGASTACFPPFLCAAITRTLFLLHGLELDCVTIGNLWIPETEALTFMANMNHKPRLLTL